MLRRFTKDQFSSGGTIDGNRLARTLSSLVERFNALTRADVEAAWVETKYVAHYRGADPALGVQEYYPFVRTDASAMLSIAETLPTPTQRWRHKAVDVEGLPYDTSSGLLGWQYAWTHSFWFERPAVVQRLTAFLQTDSVYTNDFTFPNPGTPPPGNVAGGFAKDIQLLLYVANPFASEDAEQDDVELVRRDFFANAQQFSALGVIASGGAMLPLANGNPSGLLIDFEFHEVHIPSKSRVYMALVMPEYAPAYDTPYADETVWLQFYSLCLTCLEPLES